MTTTPKTLAMAAPLELLAAAADQADALPRFKMLAYTGGAMGLEGWRYPVVVDLAGVQFPGRSMPVRFGHSAERSDGIGHTETAAVEGTSIVAAGVISRDTDAAREVVRAARNGFPWQASIGATPIEVEFIREGQTSAANGRQFGGPVYIVRASRMNEISVVDLGADQSTTTQIAAGAANNGGRDMAGDPNQNGGGTGGTAADIIARAKAERARLEGVRALAEEYTTIRGADIAGIESIVAKAEAEGWTLQATELELLRASRPKVVTQVRGQQAVTQAVLEAALCMSAGVKDEVLAKDRDYGEQVVAQAWPLRARGLRGTLAAALEAQGVSVPHGGKEYFDCLVRSQQPHQQVRAGFSTVNLPGILGNVANKVLLQAFTDIAATYDVIADDADFSNFHAHTLYRLDALGEFQQVSPAGEIKHGNLAESEYSNKLETYGQMLTLTRQHIINDDLNAFTSLLRQLARKSRIALEKALYTLVMESSDSFYTTARANRLTSNPLSIAALGAAEAALMLMADSDGEPLYAMPKYLIVPPQLKALADSIYTSTGLNETTTTDKGKPDGNPYRGRFLPVTSPYLASAAMTGYSATTWYLQADPKVLPTFQVAFLDNRKAPSVETADAEFNTLGMHLRCIWDFGVGRIDHRGTVKSTA